MLYMPPGTGYPDRIHGAFVSDQEVHIRWLTFLKSKGTPQYIDEVLNPIEVDGISDGGGDSGGEKGPTI